MAQVAPTRWISGPAGNREAFHLTKQCSAVAGRLAVCRQRVATAASIYDSLFRQQNQTVKIFKQKRCVTPRTLKISVRVSRRDAPELLKETFRPGWAW
jgi:hypothetical protein